MEPACSALLERIGFRNYIPAFEDAKIFSIQSLEIVARHPGFLGHIVGPVEHRSKFYTKMKEHVNEFTMRETEDLSVTSQLQEEPAVSIEVDERITQAELDELADSDATQFCLEEEKESSGTIVSAPQASTQSPPQSPPQSPVAKRRKANVLIDLLEKSAEGKSLIALAEKDSLDSKARVKLCGIIINAEYGADTNTIITSSRFRELAKLISETFEGEDECTYYVPAYTPRGGKTVIAKGKLYDKYTTFNKQLREVSIRSLRPGQCIETELCAPLLPARNTGNKDIAACLRFLRTCMRPWESVVEYWKDTTEYRLNELLSTGGPIKNVDDYVQQYPCLKQPKGYTLLELDFKSRFPEANLRIFSHWESFTKKVTSALSKQGVTVEDSDADLLLKFVNLFPVCPVKVPKGKAWRAARPEILQGFLLHIKVISDFEKTLERLTTTASRVGVTVQPIPLVVGPTITDIRASYVVIDKRPILVESPLRAFEVTFKCYFALHCEYPIQSQRLWIVIQKALFDIHVPWDNTHPIANLPEVKRLINLLKC